MNSTLWTTPVDNSLVRLVHLGPRRVDQTPGPGYDQRKHCILVQAHQQVDQKSAVQTPSDLHGPPGPPLRGVCVRPRRARDTREARPGRGHK
jgi:hypothetical protein